jgi:hypothetical protein
MQKDVHFYLTYALARRAGISAEDAERIAWADQFVDECVGAVHGIHTRPDGAICLEPQVQLTALIPFHFVPGDAPERPWVVTMDSTRAKGLVEEAGPVFRDGQKAPKYLRGDAFQVGIALHAYQDSFSHHGFSGWRENYNSCFPWYAPAAARPNVGHAELGPIPDVVRYVWTDPRNGMVIDNYTRAMAAAQGTWAFLAWEI